MEQEYDHSVEGQEVTESDINLISANAALADDRVLAELLRLVPFTSGSPLKGIIPYAIFTNAAAGDNSRRIPTVTPSDLSDLSVKVWPFRAVVGTRVTVGTSVRKNWQDIRSAIALGASSLATAIQLAATASNNRWDLIWARVDVDVDDPTVTRYIKAADDTVSAAPVAVTKQTKVVLGVTQGTEATTPARPSVPADSGSSYYVPLAFVLLTHPSTLVTPIGRTAIYEIANHLNLSHAFGAPALTVANHVYKDGGTIIASKTWTPATGRPPEYIPPSMNGGRSVHFALDFSASSPQSFARNTSVILDDQFDWRARTFRVFAWVGSALGNHVMAWNSNPPSTLPVPGVESGAGVAPFSNTNFFISMGQSFKDDTGLAGGVGKGSVILLSDTITAGQMATGSSILIYCDQFGNLSAKVSSTNPNCWFYFWIDASGPFSLFA